MLGLNIGIDLGTTSILIYVEGKGIVLTEASVAAIDRDSGRILAIGNKVYDMVGRNPDSIRVVRPMKDGVVSDFDVIHAMIRHYIEKICKSRIFKPNIIICMPASVTNLEKRTILELAIASGAGRACLVEEPLAAALGAGLDIDIPHGQLVVDIGGGTTDIAVITMGSIAVSKSVKLAGNVLNESIARYIRRERNILVGELTAEEIKKRVGCAYLREAELAITMRGKSYTSGLPCVFEISSTETYLAMRERLEEMAAAVCAVLEQTPPEMSADIYESGIIMTGGGALLHGLDHLISARTGIPARVADNSVECVVKGIGSIIRHMDILAENDYFFRTGDDINSYTRDWAL